MEKKTNGMSVVALVFAIIGMVGVVILGWLTFGLSSILALVGLILAIVAKKKDSEDKLAKAAFVVSLIAVILGVLTGVSCIACGACVAATPSDTSSTTSTTTAVTEKVEETTVVTTEAITETTTVETEATEKVYTVGDTIQTRKYNFTLTNAINSNIIEGEYNQEASEGKTYIVLFFEVENISDKDEFINMFNRQAYIDDYSADETYLISIDAESFSGDIAAGKKLKGYVAYEADEDWKELEWKYAEYGDDPIEFVIHPEDIK